MKDLNVCNISGSVESFQIIATKTGTPMIKAMILCGREKISVVAFKELADKIRLAEGDRVSLVGAVQSTSWEGKDGVRRYGYQIIASEITLDAATPALPESRLAAPLTQPDLPF